MKELITEEKQTTLCAHCGEHCEELVLWKDHHFCCQGCQTVYEILDVCADQLYWPFGSGSIGKRLAGSLLYNSDRILTYSLLGGIFGLIGQGFSLVAWQQVISITLGMTILMMMILPRIFVKKFHLMPRVAPFISEVKQRMGGYFSLRSYKATFLIGSLNGLLPCGLVYLGIAGAIATGSALQGILYMLLLGIGTLPLMLLVTFLGNWIGAGIRSKLRAAVPVFIWIMGFLLILRGLSLDIPYISPVISSQQHTVHSVCY